MLDLGWTELLVIGIVALIVVGPKDLPVMFRALGRFTGKMRAMARDFTRAMDEAADQSGARDIARDLRSMSNPRSAASQKFKKATGLDEFDDFDLDDEGAKDTSRKKKSAARSGDGDTEDGDTGATAPGMKAGKAHGPETAALADKRAAEARARREEAVRRANERAASYKGVDDGGEGTSPAPAPGEDAPARRAETVGGSPEGGAGEPAPDSEPKQDKA